MQCVIYINSNSCVLFYIIESTHLNAPMDLCKYIESKMHSMNCIRNLSVVYRI